MRQFDEITQKEIIKMYQNEGFTISFLSKKYHCRTEAIKNVLILNQIPIKKSGNCVNRTLKENFFEDINTEEKAYFLGLFFADGSVVLDKSGKRSPMISIALKLSDIKIIEKFKEVLNLSSALRYDKREGKETVGIGFRNEKMANDLSKYGIIPQKTYLTKKLPKVPESLERHFLRGLLDGDGSIYQETKSQKYRIDFCSCHKSICEDFRSRCNKFLNIQNNNVAANYGSAYHIRFNAQEQVKQLATVLYKDSNISIARKYQKARILFEDNSENDIVYSDH